MFSKSKRKIFNLSDTINRKLVIDFYLQFFISIARDLEISVEMCIRTLLCSEVFIVFMKQGYLESRGVKHAVKMFHKQLKDVHFLFPPSSFSTDVDMEYIADLLMIALDSPAGESYEIVKYFRNKIIGGTDYVC